MTKEDAIKILNSFEAEASAYNNAMALISYDGSTVGPKGAYISRGDTVAVLSRAAYQLAMKPELYEALQVLDAYSAELDDLTAKRVRKQLKRYMRISKIPAEEYISNSRLISEADAVWHSCKNTGDFKTFLPYLEKIFDDARRFAGYIAPDKDAFSVYLDDCEEGLTREAADDFFERVKTGLVPLIKRIGECEQIDDSFLHKYYPVEEQRKIIDHLMLKLHIDMDHCSWGETEHPFTTSFSKYDVRLTTHFYEHNVNFAISSAEHESGHAQYELNCDNSLYNTCLQGAASMAMHECSSRFFENMIGKNRLYMASLMPELRRHFPEQLSDVTDDMYYRACNRCEPSAIRIRADELTYSLHILIRYEIEKMYFDGELECKDFPAKWNELYKKYLGVDVSNDTEGVLQDSHWATGLIGYFPSYSFGSAYAAQIMAYLRTHLDIDAILAGGDIAPISDYLREHLWKFGGSITSKEALVKLTGMEFDPSYYIDYLKDKYSGLYDIKL